MDEAVSVDPRPVEMTPFDKENVLKKANAAIESTPCGRRETRSVERSEIIANVRRSVVVPQFHDDFRS